MGPCRQAALLSQLGSAQPAWLHLKSAVHKTCSAKSYTSAEGLPFTHVCGLCCVQLGCGLGQLRIQVSQHATQVLGHSLHMDPLGLSMAPQAA